MYLPQASGSASLFSEFLRFLTLDQPRLGACWRVSEKVRMREISVREAEDEEDYDARFNTFWRIVDGRRTVRISLSILT